MAIAMALACAPAQAAILFADDRGASYTASAGEANELSVTVEDGAVVLSDPGAQIQSDQCSISADGHRATCSIGTFRYFTAWLEDGHDRLSAPASAEQNTLYGGDGDDVLTGDSTHPQGPDCPFMELNNTMDGGPGDDTLNAGPGADRLRGGPGNDTIDGGGGCDVLGGDELEHWDTPDAFYEGAGGDRLLGGEGWDDLYGGPGDDLLDGGGDGDELHAGLGADTSVGGAGPDQAGYHRRTAGVVASLSGLAGSGEPGENDTIAADVELLHGGSGNDRLTGNGERNTLVGHGGDDVLDAAGGRGDTLAAGSGSDLVLAHDGAGALDGPAPPGPPWAPEYYAQRDDFVTCDEMAGDGPGRDTALLDPEDTPPSNQTGTDLGCETILFGPPRTTIAPGQTTVTVPATCTDLLTACSGAVTVSTLPSGAAGLAPKPTWKALGRRSFKRNGTRGRKVSVKLARRATRSLTRRGRARVYVSYRYKRQRARR